MDGCLVVQKNPKKPPKNEEVQTIGTVHVVKTRDSIGIGCHGLRMAIQTKLQAKADRFDWESHIKSSGRVRLLMHLMGSLFAVVYIPDCYICPQTLLVFISPGMSVSMKFAFRVVSLYCLFPNI